MTEGFSYSALPVRVLFGKGCLQALPAEVERLAWRRVMLLCTVGQRSAAQAAASLLGERLAIVHDGARNHVPVETVTPAAHLAQAHGVDGLVCDGGGSTIGLAKAIALQTRLPILAVPTTYAGSELTPIYGITGAGLKRTGRDPAVQPCVVLYDPSLSRRLPVPVSVASGLKHVGPCRRSPLPAATRRTARAAAKGVGRKRTAGLRHHGDECAPFKLMDVQNLSFLIQSPS